MVDLKKVKFSYSDEDLILKDASISLDSNKITVILGKNGIGKTTLLSLIDGFLTCDSGLVTKEKDSVFIYDNPYLYEYLTGEEYIELIKSINKKEMLPSIDEFIQELELTKDMNKLISSYSLGMKHKLALLTSLILNYDLYLIDEPLAALDPDMQNFMISFFKRMRNNQKTLIISTHMLNVAYVLADEIVIFKDLKLKKFKNDFKSYEEFENFVINSLRVQID